MTEITRTELVSRLFKTGEALLPTMTSHKMTLLHAAIGISGESGEILDSQTEFNLLQELGDTRFYVEALLQALDSNEEDARSLPLPPANNHFSGVPSERAKRRISIVAGNILDLVKKHAIYNKELDRDAILQQVHAILIAVEALCSQEAISDEEVHRENLSKLSERYNGLVYSDAAANARKDEKHD